MQKNGQRNMLNKGPREVYIDERQKICKIGCFFFIKKLRNGEKKRKFENEKYEKYEYKNIKNENMKNEVM